MRKVALTFAAVAASALLMAAGAQATVVRLADGHLAGVQIRQGASVPGVVTAASASGGRHAHQAQGPCLTAPQTPGEVSYWCGPVLHSTRDYLIFWDPTGGISSASRSLLERYLTDVSADSAEQDDVFGVVRQFYDSSGFAGAHQQFSAAQAIVDTDPYPAVDTSTCSLADCVTDAQIQAELSTVTTSQGLPRGLSGAAPIYVVVLPPSEAVCLASSSGAACTQTNFCAYHSALADQTVYAVIPFAALSPNPKGCQADDTTTVQEPNGDIADVAADNMSHELNESITDPLGTGWWDATTGAEVADDCEQYAPYANENNTSGPVNPNAYAPVLGGDPNAGTLYDQVINGDPYYTQTVWSNGDGNCQSAPAPAVLAPTFALPAAIPVGTSVRLDPTASVSAAGVSSTTWSFGDGASAFNIGAPAPAIHAYKQPGTYAVTLILVDQHGNLATATRSLRVAVLPTPAFAVIPPARAGSRPAAHEALRFDGTRTTDENSGAAIVRYVWSFGDGSAATGAEPVHSFARPGTYSVTLTVTDSLGMTQTLTQGVLVSSPGRILKVSTSGRRLQVKVSGAGRVAAAGRVVRLGRAGTARLALRLSQAQTRTLAAGRPVTLRVAVTYSPAAGPQVRRTYRITLG